MSVAGSVQVTADTYRNYADLARHEKEGRDYKRVQRTVRGAKVGINVDGAGMLGAPVAIYDNRVTPAPAGSYFSGCPQPIPADWMNVAPGDLIYVDAGTVHAIGPGSILVETQQNSDTTYRLYDYGRPRELHLEHGMRVIKERAASGKVKVQPASKLDQNGNRRQALVSSGYFVVEKFELQSEQTFHRPAGKNSAQILVATEGGCTLQAADCEPVSFGKGDAIVVPACISEFRVQPQPGVKFLKSYVPGERVPEPEIRID